MTRAAFVFLITDIFSIGAPGVARPAGHEFLPPEHWSYDALYRFESLDLISLPSHKPYARSDVIAYTTTVEDAIERGGLRLSARDRFNLERLRREFSSVSARSDPRARYDPPLWYTTDDPFQLEADVDVALVPRDKLAGRRWEFLGVGRPEARIHINDKLTYEVRYRLTLGPERDDRVRDAKPSPRERSFRGMTALFERSYAAFVWQRITVFFGRDYVDWGPAEDGNLLLSETAQSLDTFGARVRFKNLHLSTLHANLSAEAGRKLSAHRLEIALGRLLLGVSEAVLYVGRGFDPAYILPLSSFYANQFNERSNDNILWAVDVKYRPGTGTLLYGAFLIDDFQFERGDAQPDKIAFDVGARAAVIHPLPVTLRFRYRFVDIFTYTHRDSGMAFVTGVGDPSLGDPLLGADQGPDSDRLQVSAEFYPRPQVTTTLSFFFQRRGEGNDFRRFEPPLDPSPSFPSGIVEKTHSFGYAIEWELPGNSLLAIEGRHAYITRMDHDPGERGWRTELRGHLQWDFR